MRKEILVVLLILSAISAACRGLNLNGGAQTIPLQANTSEEPAGGATAGEQDGINPQPSDPLVLATPYAHSPAAGICAEFDGQWVTITIFPDIPDPRCAAIQPEQMLEVVNQRGETLAVKIGLMEVELAPGESYKFEMPFGEYLAPGVHVIEVRPCCGAELVLDLNP